MLRTFLILAAMCLIAGSCLASTLEDLAKPRDYTSHRVSSAWPGGGNGDGTQQNPVKAGETRTIADIKCVGQISHLWFTISPFNKETLCNLILRIYWDDETTPSVEAPLGAFFGLGFGKEYSFDSAPISVVNNRGMNSFFPMPFNRHVKITLENQSDLSLNALYYYVDYKQYQAPRPGILFFHAQYRQAKPALSRDNYTVLEASGSGHYVGLFYYVRANADGWWGEGDDQFFIDGSKTPTLAGTGMEDYFCGAWGLTPSQNFLRSGSPLWEVVMSWGPGNENAAYRWHLDDAIAFKKCIRVTQEHGSDNDRSDDFASVAFWYQTHPHAPFPALPSKFERLSFAERRQGLKGTGRTSQYRALLSSVVDKTSDIGILKELAESYTSQGDKQAARKIMEKYAGGPAVEGWTKAVKELAAKLSLGDIDIPQSDVTIIACDDGRGIPDMIDDQRCICTCRAFHSAYIYFKVNRDDLRTTPRDITLEIDCSAQKPGRLLIEYNSMKDKCHEASATLEKGHQSIEIALHAVKLSAGRFGTADMRMSNPDGDVWVRSVRLLR